MADVGIKLPEKLEFLFAPARYKVARGGRGSAKSWSFARALEALGIQKRLRILCAREVQNSIKQSVHKLLCDQIELMGLQRFYRPLETEIRGKNGTEFLFTGLSNLTIDTIKSFEGIDIVWVEEGQTITKRSWDILIPTIRKEGSEVWISYNPDLESDETHQRFTVSPPPDCINVEINWRDNPYFTEVMNKERLHCKATDPDNYDNIWEGKCRPAVEGAIYYKQIQDAESKGHICSVPYDPMLKVQLVADIGRNDFNPIGLFQVLGSEYRMIGFIPGKDKQDWPWYNTELRKLRYNWGKFYLPHDGHAKRMESLGLSSADILRKLGWNVPSREQTTDVSIEEGIRITRMKFGQLRIDKDKCAEFIENIKRYRRNVNTKTGAETQPVHDEHSHAADMLRGFMVNVDQMSNYDDFRQSDIMPDYEEAY